jgi:hypothetical protein
MKRATERSGVPAKRLLSPRRQLRLQCTRCRPRLKGTTKVAPTEHELYRSRKAARHFVSLVAAGILLLCIVERLFRSGLSFGGGLVLSAAGLGVLWLINWFVEQQYPDPNPAETKRLDAEAAMVRAAEAKVREEKRAAQKVIDDQKRAEQKVIDDQKRAEKAEKLATEKAAREKEAFEFQQRAEAAEPVITAILENEAALGLTSEKDKKLFRVECLVQLYAINPGMAVLIGLGWEIFVELEVQKRAMEKEAERQKRVAAAANVLSRGESSYRFLKKFMK